MNGNHLHRMIAGLVGSLAAAGLLLGASIVPAAAATYVQGRGLGSVYNLGAGTGVQIGFWVGTFKTTSGVGFCIQPTRDWSGAVAIGDPAQVTSFTNDQGKALTKTQMNQLAALMWMASANGVTTNKTAAAYKLAMMTIAGYNHIRVNRGGSSVSAAYYNFSLDDAKSDGTKIATSFAILTQANNLVAQARARANNWDGTGTLSFTDKPLRPGEKMVTRATLPGIGTGVGVAFTVISPDGSAKTITVNTDNNVAEMTYTPTQYGDYSVSAKLAANASPRYPWIAVSSTNQSLLIIKGKSRTWSSSLKLTLELPPPVIGTQISDQVVMPGQTIHDTVLLSDLVSAEGVEYSIDGGLYALAPDDDGACPGPDSPDWATAQQLVSIDNAAVPLEHQIAASPIDNALPSDDDSSAAAVSDDVSLGDATPPDDAAPPDDMVPLDDALPADDTVPADDTTPSDDVPPAQVVDNIKMTMKLGEWTVPDDQMPICVSYGETITMRLNGQVKAVVEHPAGSPDQTGITLPLPNIVTQISAPEANQGDPMTDTVTIGGIDPAGRADYVLGGRLIEVTMPSSGQCPGEGDPVWDKGKTLTTIDQTITPDMASPDGQVVVADLGQWITPASSTAKCVTYTETVTITIAGHDPVVVDHPAGNPSQTAKTVPVPEEKPPIKPPTVLFDTGGQMAPAVPWQPWVIGLGVVLALAVVVAIGTRPLKNR